MLKTIIRRPVAVTMVVLVIIVLGIVTIGRIPVSMMPDIDIPSLSVQIDAPEMSASDIDESVIHPLRQKFSQIGGLKDLVCESKDGSASIRMNFEPGTGMDYVFIEANEKIDQSMNALKGISRPKVMKSNASDIPAFHIGFYQEGDDGRAFADFSTYIEDVVVRRLEQLPQVAMVDFTGTVDKEIVITPDLEKLHSLGIGLREFSSYIKSANFRLGSLSVRDGEYHYNIKFLSAASTAEDIAEVWFKAGDRLVRIGDVAEVVERQKEPSGLARSDGHRAVVLAVVKQGDARMSDLRQAVQRTLDDISGENPTLSYTITRDQTELLEFSIRNLFQNILLAILLSCVVIMLFMRNLRTVSLVTITIPVSLLLTVCLFAVLGISINVISLSGLILGVGMMVDGSIILVDNIGRLVSEGTDRDEAILRGTSEVRGAMLSSVLTTCAVFIPLVFINGTAGALFYDQAMAITTVLMSSYLVTILVLPVYYRLWGGGQAQRHAGLLHRWYERVMEFCLSHRVLIYPTVLVCLAAGALSFIMIERTRLPEMSHSDALVTIDWNANLNVRENSSRVARLEQEDLRAEQMTAIIGTSQFILPEMSGQGSSEATIYLKCADPASLSEALQRLSDRIRSSYPEAIVTSRPSGNIFESIFADTEQTLVARLRPLSGTEMSVESLRAQRTSLMEKLGIGIPEIPVKRDILYVADPQLMTLYGIGYDELLGNLRTTLGGDKLFDIAQGERSIPVYLSEDGSGGGDGAVLSHVTKMSFSEEIKTVTSGLGGRYYPLSFDVRSSEVKPLMAKIEAAVREDGLFDVSFSGSWFATQRLIREMLLVLLLSVLLLYLILAAQFESLLQPLIILSEIVIDISLSLLALLLAGESLNLMSLIGLVVICGIVINDSILKVDTINRLRASGLDMDSAILRAGKIRVDAIVMTSLTTIFAALPFLSRGTMGNDLQYPMAFVVVVGMAVGTLVSLFLVPLMYSVTGRK